MRCSQLHLQLTKPAAELSCFQRPVQRWRAFSAPAQPARRSCAVHASEQDEARYPERNAWTGGWAGGEKGVQKFVAEFEEEPSKEQKQEIKKAAEKDPNVVKVEFQGRKVAARRVSDKESDSDPIYVGVKKGAKDADSPTFLLDDQRKYPTRDPLVGGFAGGERGVQQYVEEGEVKIAERGRRQSSPLVTAAIVATLGTVGGLFLVNVKEASQEIVESVERGDFSRAASAVSRQTSSALSFDPNTKLALEVGLAVFGVVVLIYYGRKAAGSLANNAREGVISLTKLAVFWGVVLLAAKYVIEH